MFQVKSFVNVRLGWISSNQCSSVISSSLIIFLKINTLLVVYDFVNKLISVYVEIKRKQEN